ncbi:MAG: hypothetical protein AABX46_00035 [Thermoproteota archaeon]
MKDKILIVRTTDVGHVEMYLKAIWPIEKICVDIKFITIIKLFNNMQSYIIQIIQKLSLKNLLNYKTSIVDNSKLLEGN